MYYTKISLLIIYMIIPFISFSQGKQDFTGAREILLDGYFEAYRYNEQGELDKDIVYFVNTQIRVWPSWYEKEINGKDYVIVDYDAFKEGISNIDSLYTAVNALPKKPIRIGLWKVKRVTIAIEKDVFQHLKKEPIYNAKFWSKKSTKFVTGQLTLPFKLRPAIDSVNFQMSTDVTLGAYGGIRKRLSKMHDVFVTIPASGGLTYINLTSSNTSPKAPGQNVEDRIVPGVSWATGLLFQVRKFNVGFLLGADYASQVGKDWLYQGKVWYSFAIGYSFSTIDD